MSDGWPNRVLPLCEHEHERSMISSTVCDHSWTCPCRRESVCGPIKATIVDMKESLGSSRKPDITHIRTPLMVYGARACEYGGAKYERGNFLRPTICLREDFRRLRSYLRAAMSHIVQTLDAMEVHESGDPELVDEIGMRRAAYAEDVDPDNSGKVGPSGLPHLCGAVASLNMAITQAVRAGLLPADPGQPWATRAEREKAKGPK